MENIFPVKWEINDAVEVDGDDGGSVISFWIPREVVLVWFFRPVPKFQQI